MLLLIKPPSSPPHSMNSSPSSDWVLDRPLPDLIAEETSTQPVHARNLTKLFAEGSEIAYVSRYRGDAHGGMSCEQIRSVFTAYKQTIELNTKCQKAIANIRPKVEPGQLNDVIDRLGKCREVDDVTEITKTFSVSKRSKADMARSLGGIAGAADAIMRGEVVNLENLVDPANKDVSSLKKVEEQVGYCIADSLNRLEDTTQLARRISHLEHAATRIDVVCSQSAKSKKWTEKDKEFPLIGHFANYTDFRRLANRVENHVILAMQRGEEKEVLKWKVEVQFDFRHHPAARLRIAPPHRDLFQSASKDSIDRLFVPKLVRHTMRFLTQRAEQSAIDRFSSNLSQLLTQESIAPCHVAALDPGYAACKAAFLAPDGSVLDAQEFRLFSKGRTFDSAGNQTLVKWAGLANRRMIIAIGNGTASTETQHAVSAMLKNRMFGNTDVKFCVVPESGASKYSITPLAEQELPNMPITQKSAVSIGRRILNPMAEYVKIEPKHLGVGQYQHSVNEKKLSDALSLVVRDVVSLHGVDVNMGGLHLLQQVCGLTKRSASGIISLRESNGGRISSREQLKKVAGLGPKSFEQCAGFLTISPPSSSDFLPQDVAPAAKKRKIAPSSSPSSLSYDYLDSTIVHPDQYATARSLLGRLGIDSSSIHSEASRKKLREVDEKSLSADELLVRSLLTSARKTVPPPPLMTEMRSLASLRVGERFVGRVANRTDFGLFIDIGAEKDGLAHKSVIAEYPEVGSMIDVVINKIDVKGISLRPL